MKKETIKNIGIPIATAQIETDRPSMKYSSRNSAIKIVAMNTIQRSKTNQVRIILHISWSSVLLSGTAIRSRNVCAMSRHATGEGLTLFMQFLLCHRFEHLHLLCRRYDESLSMLYSRLAHTPIVQGIRIVALRTQFQ